MADMNQSRNQMIANTKQDAAVSIEIKGNEIIKKYYSNTLGILSSLNIFFFLFL